MSTEKNITMKQFNGTDYDTLYPKTNAEQVDGVYSKDEVLSNSTKALYGLTDSAAPDDAFAEISKKIGSKVTVYTEENTVVTATNGELTMRKNTGGNNSVDFLLVAFGNWVFSVEAGGSTVTKTVTVSDFNSQTIVLAPALATATWSFINIIAELGVASKAWSIGDTKPFTIDGATYEAQIIGFNHDQKTSGGVAGITFETKTCYGTTGQMNTTNTNAGGWSNCAMRNTTLPALLAKMNTDLVSVIKQVDKKTSSGSQSSTIVTTVDTLFLLSEVEYFNSTSYSFAGEGYRYEYYTAGNTAVKQFQGSEAYTRWERSPVKNQTNSFAQVKGGVADADGHGASYYMPFTFAFCV